MSTTHRENVRWTFWDGRMYDNDFENRVKQIPIDNIGIAQSIYETISLITTAQPHRNEEPEPIGG